MGDRMARAFASAVLVVVLSLALAGEANATFPGANGRIAFEISGADGATGISAVNQDGSGRAVILNGKNGLESGTLEDGTRYETWVSVGYSDVAVSPDGSKLAFIKEDSWSNDYGSVYVSNADGSNVQRVTQMGNHLASDPAWSPDGKQLVFTAYDLDGGRAEHPHSIWRTDVDGTNLVMLHGARSSVFAPDWSPSGDKIAFSGYSEGSDAPSELWVMNADGTGKSALTSTEDTGESHPNWAPDGRKLLFTDSEGDLETINADGTARTTLMSAVHVSTPVWSPDGSKIAYVDNLPGVDSAVLAVANADGTGSRVIVSDMTSASISWGPSQGAISGDGDQDGLADDVDLDRSTPSTSFDDRAGTTGVVTAPNGLAVAVEDAAGSAGVKISVGAGTGEAGLQVCGFSVRLAAGSTAFMTCGSVHVEVVSGTARVVLANGTAQVEVPKGSAARVSEQAEASFLVDRVTGGSVAITVDGIRSTVAAGATKILKAWDFQGFSEPVDSGGVLNVVKAGQAVPLRWRVVKADGTPVTTLASATVTVAGYACTGSTADQVEETATGKSGLVNLNNGYYQFNWQIPKDYAQSCKTMRLDIGDGVTHDALFKFTK